MIRAEVVRFWPFRDQNGKMYLTFKIDGLSEETLIRIPLPTLASVLKAAADPGPAAGKPILPCSETPPIGKVDGGYIWRCACGSRSAVNRPSATPERATSLWMLHKYEPRKESRRAGSGAGSQP